MPTGIYKRKPDYKGYWFGKKRPPFSEEWKRKIGDGSRGHKHSLGRKPSEETKKKMSIARSNYLTTHPEAIERIRETSKGRKVSIKTRLKLSEARKREKSYNWKGGVETENKVIRKSVKYRLWREAIFARDKWTCRRCEKVGGILNPHHIMHFALYKNQRFNVSNGITLCVKCHKHIHKIERYKVKILRGVK